MTGRERIGAARSGGASRRYDDMWDVAEGLLVNIMRRRVRTSCRVHHSLQNENKATHNDHDESKDVTVA